MADEITIYGIRNCDTMKKARNWLEGRGIAYSFHDYKTSGIDARTLRQWAKQAGWEKLLNRAGTTFKKLPEKEREGINEARAISLMVAQPSLIKRPVLVANKTIIIGFKQNEYAGTLIG